MSELSLGQIAFIVLVIIVGLPLVGWVLGVIYHPDPCSYSAYNAAQELLKAEFGCP